MCHHILLCKINLMTAQINIRNSIATTTLDIKLDQVTFKVTLEPGRLHHHFRLIQKISSQSRLQQTIFAEPKVIRTLLELLQWLIFFDIPSLERNNRHISASCGIWEPSHILYRESRVDTEVI